jgi:poly-gamma-glutamate capsule biosynthesis protein CapA/YwtB (metallophosphatase superfamily)
MKSRYLSNQLLNRLPVLYLLIFVIGCFADGNHAQAVSGDPEESGSPAEVLYLQGFEQQQNGNSVAAIDLYKQALEIDPKHVASHWEMGWSYYAQTEWALAIDAWEQVEAIEPTRDQLDIYLQEVRENLALEKRMEELNVQSGQASTGAAIQALTAPKTDADGRRVVQVVSVGHIVMGTDYPPSSPRLPPNDGVTLFDGCKTLLRNADVAFGNLAVPVSDRGSTAKKVNNKTIFAFRAPARYINLLADAGLDVVNAANNHIFDFGATAYEDTLAGLDRVGVAHTGRIGEVYVRDVHGISVAVVSMTQPYRKFFQTHHDVEAAAALVASIADKYDVVVVGFHGGNEFNATHTPRKPEYMGREYRGEPYRLSHALIDAGADLVVGFGPHLPRAMEYYKGRLISYSLGNFVTYGPFNLRGASGLSIALEVNFYEDGEVASAVAHPFILRPRGIPQPDPDLGAIKHLRWVSSVDFPESAPEFSDEGLITPKAPIQKAQ